jgi:hypothetical protein
VSEPARPLPIDWLPLLTELQAAVAEQAARLQMQDLSGLAIAGRRVDELLRAAQGRPPVPEGRCRELLRQIQDQHGRICVQLSLQKQETAAELATMRRGRTALRAYSGHYSDRQ